MSKCPNCGFELDTQADVLDEYSGSEAKKAVPVVSDYRERYKKHQIRVDEITPKKSIAKKVQRQDTELDSYRYKGDSLFFGPGIEVEF